MSIQILMQRLGIGEVPGKRVKPVEGAGCGVVVSGAQVLQPGELVGLLPAVEEGGQGRGEVEADGDAIGVVGEDLRGLDAGALAS